MNTEALRVWLVDDDASIRWVLERALRQGGMSPTAFEHADTVIAALRRNRPDVLITDIRMPGRSGLELLTEIRDSQPELPVIVMTAHSDLDSAVASCCARACAPASTSDPPATASSPTCRWRTTVRACRRS